MRTIESESKPIAKYKANLANAVTLLNLSVGCLSILSMFKNEHVLSIELILISCVLDRLDGKIARKLGIASKFGKELDSLSDLVSFGVAPALLVWLLSLDKIPVYGSAIAVIYVLCGALRLARFNVSENCQYFVGVPITIAGGILALISFFIIKYDLDAYLVAVLTMILSYCMVTSNLKITKM